MLPKELRPAPGDGIDSGSSSPNLAMYLWFSRFHVFRLRIWVTFRDSPFQPSVDPQRSLRLDWAPPSPRSRTTFELPVQAGQMQHHKQQTKGLPQSNPSGLFCSRELVAIPSACGVMTISRPTAPCGRGEVVPSGPVSRIEAKTLSQP